MQVGEAGLEDDIALVSPRPLHGLIAEMTRIAAFQPVLRSSTVTHILSFRPSHLIHGAGDDVDDEQCGAEVQAFLRLLHDQAQKQRADRHNRHKSSISEMLLSRAHEPTVVGARIVTLHVVPGDERAQHGRNIE